jgi:hypothetical protein
LTKRSSSICSSQFLLLVGGSSRAPCHEAAEVREFRLAGVRSITRWSPYPCLSVAHSGHVQGEHGISPTSTALLRSSCCKVVVVCEPWIAATRDDKSKHRADWGCICTLCFLFSSGHRIHKILRWPVPDCPPSVRLAFASSSAPDTVRNDLGHCQRPAVSHLSPRIWKL